ncbi:MAG: HlyD family secretion protein [Pyrinomonadaceae bacterium]
MTQKNIRVNEETEKDSVLNEEIILSSDDEKIEKTLLPALRERRSRIPVYIISGIVLASAIAGFGWWLYARQFATTDDALIQGNISLISPKITARVAKIYVEDNQAVKKDDLLVELEANEVTAKLEKARATLLTAQASLEKAKANVTLTRADSQAGLNQASSNLQTANNTIEQTKIASSIRQNGIAQAQSRAEMAEASVRQMQAQIPAAAASIAQAKAQVTAAKSKDDVARLESERDRALFQVGDVSKQKLDLSNRELSESSAGLTSAEKGVEIAEARLVTLHRQVEFEAAHAREAQTGIQAAENDYRQSIAQVNVVASQADESAGRLAQARALPARVAVDQSEVNIAEANIAEAQAALTEAEIELQNTKIYAPQDGFISQKAVQTGQLVQPDSSLMMVTQPGIWVVANYKETQIERIQIGQPVDIYVDAYPSVTFHGRVESFQAGTGSRFSILPTENATGNFVKVVQRISVKIVFDEMPDSRKYLLFPGMSVVPKIRIR